MVKSSSIHPTIVCVVALLSVLVLAIPDIVQQSEDLLTIPEALAPFTVIYFIAVIMSKVYFSLNRETYNSRQSHLSMYFVIKYIVQAFAIMLAHTSLFHYSSLTFIAMLGLSLKILITKTSIEEDYNNYSLSLPTIDNTDDAQSNSGKLLARQIFWETPLLTQFGVECLLLIYIIGISMVRLLESVAISETLSHITLFIILTNIIVQIALLSAGLPQIAHPAPSFIFGAYFANLSRICITETSELSRVMLYVSMFCSSLCFFYSGTCLVFKTKYGEQAKLRKESADRCNKLKDCLSLKVVSD